MQLDDRSSSLLQELLSNPSVKSKNLEVKYGLSRRQISYSLEKINDWLEGQHLPKIERNQQGDFIVDATLFSAVPDEVNKPSTKKYIFSEAERVELIILMLLSRCEELSLIHFTSSIYVSKNTILNDLKMAQSIVEPYDLIIRYSRRFGYSIEGLEFQKRKLLIDVVNKIHHMYNGETWVQQLAEITEEEVQLIHERLEKIETHLNLKFTDDKMTTLPHILLILLRRIKLGKTINSFHINYEELSDTKEYQAVQELLTDFAYIPTEERLFITLQILTTNVSSSERLEEDLVTDLNQALEKMLELFEQMSCILLQDKKQLLHMMMQHIKPAYYRIKYKLTITNPLQETINSEFIELHHLVKKSALPLAEFIGCDIPDSECTYLTMLIGGWLTKQGDSILSKTKAVVVCTNGVSISKLLLITLNDLFPEFIFLDSLSVREFKTYDLEYDIVFSSVYLQTNKRLFIVKPILQNEEKSSLRKQVMESLHGFTPSELSLKNILEIVEKYAIIQNRKLLAKELQHYFTNQHSLSFKSQPELQKTNLHDLIMPENITLLPSVSSWEEAVRLGALPLLLNGSIKPSYVEAMIQHYDVEDPYIIISPYVAIPHDKPESGVSEVSMSLLRLEQGVEFAKNRPIQIVVIIAAVDKQQHLRALVQLMKLVESREDCEAIIRAQTPSDIHNIITKYGSD
ncbi:BglG family transcription antiterminator [Paenibacillus sp. NPDC058177]|uniref:BglG family transcription antiterminator n=1 Tax=Paenibacillus sp. NPDC058177 TaxID=3346369 RepID=UPI0036D8275A